MSTYSLQLLKFKFDPKNLVGPMAYIALKNYSCESFKLRPSKEIKFVLLSPQCVNFNEINYNADRLIKELEKIKKQAKSFFQKEFERRKK